MAVKNPTHPKLTYLAGLPDDVIITNIVKRENCDEFYITLKPPEHRTCPNCGSNDCVIKEISPAQTVRHVPVARRGTILTFRKYRLFCKTCNATFFEQLEWLHPSLRITTLLFLNLCLDLTQMLSIAIIASINGVSSSVVSSVLDNIVWERPPCLPETLGIDEFSGTSGEWDPETSKWDVNKYHCNLSDVDCGIIIDILPQIDSDFLKQYFRGFPPSQRARVKFFCCDMHRGFASVARDIFPNARICIDMFHVVNLINRKIDAIRIRLQNEMKGQEDTQKYRLLKNAARSLKTSEIKQERLGNSNNAKRLERLKALFDLFPDLALAYNALQEFHFISNKVPLLFRKSYLTDWIAQCSNSHVPELQSLAHSIRHWRGYIQNAWEYSRSNGTCEGLNNKIETLTRVSFGLHSFETFRKRVLLTCGPIRLANEPFAIFREKRNGKGIKF